MCGIGLVWNREGVFPEQVYKTLFEHTEKRGNDGFGYSICGIGGQKLPVPYSNLNNKMLLDNISKNLDIGISIIFISRATPETEVQSSTTNMQPIRKFGLELVHNGVVSERSIAKYKYKHGTKLGYETSIDSEAILNSFIANNKDMKKTMEQLEGGFAFILYDKFQKRIYIVNDYKPLAIGYWKGYGLIVHSSLEALKDVNKIISDTDRCGMNVWEDYYFHRQEPYTIRSIDLDSGMERLDGFKPNFYHPIWDNKKSNGKELCLVSCSGGIDSGLTAYVLKMLGYNVKLVYFNYGQKGHEAEQFCVDKLAEFMEVEALRVDLVDFYSLISDPSMLIDKDISVTTGTVDDIKTTAAWVAGRNMMFLTHLATIAEAEILNNNWDKVWIASGMSNLSEEGFYPDNSEYFIDAFESLVKLGCITGHRISHLPVFRNIMKFEEWALGDKLGFPFDMTCSCDNPKVEGNSPILCADCGSTKLSIFASKMAGVEDPRLFYNNPKDKDLISFKGAKTDIDIHNIITRLCLPNDDISRLLDIVDIKGPM